jgi:hypothetical protein
MRLGGPKRTCRPRETRIIFPTLPSTPLRSVLGYHNSAPSALRHLQLLPHYLCGESGSHAYTEGGSRGGK